MQYEQEQRRRTVEPHVPFGWVLAAIVSLEAAWLFVNSVVVFARLHTDYRLWPVTVASGLIWPALFIWVAYVLWRPKFPQSSGEAIRRSWPVWLVIVFNALFVIAVLSHPGWVLRWPW